MDNPLFNAFGGFANFMKSFGQFKQNVQQNGINPQQQVQQLLNSGQMTQEQCNRGLVRHRDETGNFLLAGRVRCRRCQNAAQYKISVCSNITVAEGGTAGPVTIALVVDGAVIPASQMEETIDTVGDFANVARTIDIPIWAGCCQTVTLRNTGTQPIQARNTNIDIISPV